MRIMLPRHLNLINSLIVRSHILTAPGNTHTFAIYVRVNVRVRRRYGAATRISCYRNTYNAMRAYNAPTVSHTRGVLIVYAINK
jgi:hypothetical protein